MKDSVTFQQSNQNEITINISIGELKKELKKRGYNIKDIATVIHNHRRKNYFTRNDYKQYWMLKSFGFNGQFLLYCHRTDETCNIEDEGK